MSGKFIKERREELGYSQSQFAELNDINLRSLQEYEQGRKPVKSIKGDVLYKISKGLGCSIEDILVERTYHTDYILPNHLDKYAKVLSNIKLYGEYYKFPIVADSKKIDMSRIHPLKQKLVVKLNESLTSEENIASIMLFGSSITMRCTYESDIDLAVRLKQESVSEKIKNDISEKIQNISDWNADILWFDRLTKGDRIYHDICKGVQIV